MPTGDCIRLASGRTAISLGARGVAGVALWRKRAQSQRLVTLNRAPRKWPTAPAPTSRTSSHHSPFTGSSPGTCATCFAANGPPRTVVETVPMGLVSRHSTREAGRPSTKTCTQASIGTVDCPRTSSSVRCHAPPCGSGAESWPPSGIEYVPRIHAGWQRPNPFERPAQMPPSPHAASFVHGVLVPWYAGRATQVPVRHEPSARWYVPEQNGVGAAHARASGAQPWGPSTTPHALVALVMYTRTLDGFTAREGTRPTATSFGCHAAHPAPGSVMVAHTDKVAPEALSCARVSVTREVCVLFAGRKATTQLRVYVTCGDALPKKARAEAASVNSRATRVSTSPLGRSVSSGTRLSTSTPSSDWAWAASSTSGSSSHSTETPHPATTIANANRRNMAAPVARNSGDAARAMPATTEELVARALEGEEDDEGAWEAVNELRRRGGAAELQAAKALIQSTDAKRRGRGVDVLAQLGMPEPSEELKRECVGLLLDTLAMETESSVLNSIGTALGHQQAPEAVDAMWPHRAHPDAGVRLGVVMAMSNHPVSRAIEALITLSSDEDEDVRNWACFGLGSQLETVDTPALRDALAARLDDQNREVRGEALFGLAARQDLRALEPIRRALQDPGVIVLEIEAAAALGDHSFLPLLEAVRAKASEANDFFISVLNDAIASFAPRGIDTIRTTTPSREAQGYEDFEARTPDGERVWQQSIHFSDQRASPNREHALWLDANVVAIGAHGEVVCLDLETGAEKKRFQIPSHFLHLAVEQTEGGEQWLFISGIRDVHAIGPDLEQRWHVKDLATDGLDAGRIEDTTLFVVAHRGAERVEVQLDVETGGPPQPPPEPMAPCTHGDD